MSHYEKRLEEDLAAIRRRIYKLRRSIDALIGDAVHSLLTGDRALANQTILADNPINRETRRLDAACHAFVARHLPSAGHLRYVSSVMRLSVGLERIGDYAASISREALQLAKPPDGLVARGIDLMSDQGRKVLSQAVQSFLDNNADVARGTVGMAAQGRDLYTRVFDDLIASQELDGRSLKELFALQVVLYRLERISAQAKNICEEAIFAATGETKTPKVYRVLFVDQRGETFSPLAVAIARRAYPESGDYKFAGVGPVGVRSPLVTSFLESRGLDSLDIEDAEVEATPDELNNFHVIVGLEGSLDDDLAQVPFKTMAFDWNLVRDLDGLDRERAEAMLLELQRELSTQIRELMEALRGKDAS